MDALFLCLSLKKVKLEYWSWFLCIKYTIPSPPSFLLPPSSLLPISSFLSINLIYPFKRCSVIFLTTLFLHRKLYGFHCNNKVVPTEEESQGEKEEEEEEVVNLKETQENKEVKKIEKKRRKTEWKYVENPTLYKF